MLQTLLIAVSLSMDALAVSVSAAACSGTLKKSCMLRAAFTFGLFQFIMPMIGWFGASFFVKYAAAFDHWLAFFLLVFVGGKTIAQTVAEMRGARKRSESPSGEDGAAEPRSALNLESMKTLLALAVATSIDALTIGIVYASMNEAMLAPALIIGCVTFAICSCGFAIGKKAGAFFGKYAQLAGGVVLVLIGVRILVTHLFEG